jgi:Ni/Co efflux regulator RcnB
MISIRSLLIVVAVTLAFAVNARPLVSAQTSSAGPQSTYKLAAGRDKDDSGARGSDRSPAVVKPDDDDDKPRIRRRPDDQSTRDRIDRGDYYPERDTDRLKGRNYRD